MNKIGLLVLLIVINSSKVIAQQITPKMAFLENEKTQKVILLLLPKKCLKKITILNLPKDK